MQRVRLAKNVLYRIITNRFGAVGQIRRICYDRRTLQRSDHEAESDKVGSFDQGCRAQMERG
jgi:hypothetical protein